MMETYADRLNSEEFKKKLEKAMGPRASDIRPTITQITAREESDRNVEEVVAQLRWRAEKGLQKYGVTTERKDLSVLEWLQHLQEELMDASVYIEKLKSEIKQLE
jgi:hypothetical protein